MISIPRCYVLMREHCRLRRAHHWQSPYEARECRPLFYPSTCQPIGWSFYDAPMCLSRVSVMYRLLHAGE